MSMRAPIRNATEVRRRIALGLAAAGAFCAAPAFGQLTISNVPMTLFTKPGPNIIVTLDDSGSMAQAHVPDGLQNVSGTRRYRSAYFNPMYYNPDVTYPRPLDANGQPLLANETTLFTNAPINGFDTSRGRVDLSTNYLVTVNFNPGSGGHTFAGHPAADFAPASQNTGTQAYYYLYDTAVAGCDGQKTTENCYRLVQVSATSGPGGTDERENFANWYSFYRTRNLATVSAAALAMANVREPARVAWQALNTCNGVNGDPDGAINGNCSGWDGVQVSNLIRRFSNSHRQNFYQWLFRLPANNSTPLQRALRRAGEYYRTTGNDSPYGADPNQLPQVTGVEHACRPNYHILMTDGLWNNSLANCGSGTCGNQDGSNQSMPDTTAYSPRAPFRDDNANSLADLAFYYWRTDLRPDLVNNVARNVPDPANFPDADYWNPRYDPANWQHMVNFTVGLGLSGFLSSPTYGGDTFAPQFDRFESGAAAWPDVGSSSPTSDGGAAGVARVYDLWHAAVNSRGAFFSADSPTQLANALQTAIQKINSAVGSGSAAAVNSSALDTGSRVYVAGFNATDWTGTVRAYALTMTGQVGSQQWSSRDSGRIPAANSRSIVTWDGSNGIAFRDTSLGSLWGTMGLGSASDTERSNIVNYLRGDAANEKANGGSFRARSTPLGDIVNSSIAYAGGQNFGYTRLAEGSTESYASFVVSKRARTPMIYVGANDGMLHAFNAATSGSSAGTLTFSYMPNAVLSGVKDLADPAYVHRYFVDGSPAIGDAFFSSAATGAKWRNVLVGSTGAGAKAVFAIDVTDPADLATESSAAGKVLWEVSSATADFGDLGYVLSKPAIARLNDGSWAAIFANGYSSTTQCAVLFIVNIENGQLIRKIDTENRAPSTASCASANGLSEPALLDANSDGIIDYVYAGDLQGNVWKFDLSSTSASSWGVAFGGAAPTPLFTAVRNGVRQPITAPIEIGPAPTSSTAVMIYVGTGRFFATIDPTDTSVQSLYGLLDSNTPIADRTSLSEQTYSESTVSIAGSNGVNTPATVRTLSNNDVGARGWFIDFSTPANSGERIVTMPMLNGGRLFAITLIPQDDPCVPGGASWLMAVNPANGGAISGPVFDINGDGTITSVEYYSMVKREGRMGLAYVGSGSAASLLSSKTGEEGAPARDSVTPIAGTRGRASWRQILK
jgi:type IV pilus assembly protein PilY1